MSINDDGDIVRGIGFITVYSAYLENKIAELIELTGTFSKLRKNIFYLSMVDQIKHLMRSLEKQFEEAENYHSKNIDQKKITTTLNKVEKIAEARNKAIHSVLISGSSGIVMQKNRRNSTKNEIKSSEAYALANNIYTLQTEVSGLKFPITRLKQQLTNINKKQ